MNSRIKETFWQGKILLNEKFRIFFLPTTISATGVFTYGNQWCRIFHNILQIYN
jgi:hypothetical protein